MYFSVIENNEDSQVMKVDDARYPQQFDRLACKNLENFKERMKPNGSCLNFGPILKVLEDKPKSNIYRTFHSIVR